MGLTCATSQRLGSGKFPMLSQSRSKRPWVLRRPVGEYCRSSILSHYLSYETLYSFNVSAYIHAPPRHKSSYILPHLVHHMVQYAFLSYNPDRPRISMHSQAENLETLGAREMYQYTRPGGCHSCHQSFIRLFYPLAAHPKHLASAAVPKTEIGHLICVCDRFGVRDLVSPNISRKEKLLMKGLVLALQALCE